MYNTDDSGKGDDFRRKSNFLSHFVANSSSIEEKQTADTSNRKIHCCKIIIISFSIIENIIRSALKVTAKIKLSPLLK